MYGEEFQNEFSDVDANPDADEDCQFEDQLKKETYPSSGRSFEWVPRVHEAPPGFTFAHNGRGQAVGL